MLVGTAAAATPLGEVSWLRFVLALAVALLLQTAVNYANDYFDGVKGVDTAERTGPRRAVASGLLSPAAMKRAIALTLAAAAVAGLALALLVGLELLLVGVAAIAATLGYSGGSKPYASAALGEVMVFVFFGLVATAGSAYVQDETLTLLPVLAAVPIGALATALLVVNNLRDIPTDAPAGKRTLAVRLGDARTRQLFVALVVVAYALLVPIGVVARQPLVGVALLSAVSLAPAIHLVRTAPPGPQLIRTLERTAQGQLLYAVALTLALSLPTWWPLP